MPVFRYFFATAKANSAVHFNTHKFKPICGDCNVATTNSSIARVVFHSGDTAHAI